MTENKPAASAKKTALYLVATPIGNDQDLSPRATQLLLEAKFVIGEEFRPLTTILKRIGRPRPADPKLQDFDVLNEHSKPADVVALADRVQRIAEQGGFSVLVSDCGTPGFSDPGPPLVRELRKRGYSVSAAPGPSALMCLLSVSGIDTRRFVFAGFLSAEKEERQRELQALKRESRPIVLMDTPYRLERLLDELASTMPERRATMGCDFTKSNELILEDTTVALKKIWQQRPDDQRKAEFMLVLHEDGSRSNR